jgi:hypothetical protein
MMSRNARLVSMLRDRFLATPAVQHASDTALLRAYTLFTVTEPGPLNWDRFPAYVVASPVGRAAMWNRATGVICL